jgi:fructokinase
VSRMRAGDPDARRTYDLFLDRLGRGVAHVVNILDPDVIVLGGGLSEVDELYADLPARIAPFVFSDAFDAPVRKSRHGPSSGVRGAAWLWNG